MANILRVRVALNGWQGAPGLLTYYFRPNQATNAVDALNAVTRVRAAMLVLAPLFPNLVALQVSGTCDVLDDTTGALIASTAVAPPAVVIGSAATVLGPPQVMGGIQFDTGAISDGRKLRARSFIGPLSTSFTTQVTPPAALLSTLAACGVALVGVAPPLAATPMVAWHRPRKATPLKPFRSGSSQNVLSSAPATKFFTLRSRLN